MKSLNLIIIMLITMYSVTIGYSEDVIFNNNTYFNDTKYEFNSGLRTRVINNNYWITIAYRLEKLSLFDKNNINKNQSNNDENF